MKSIERDTERKKMIIMGHGRGEFLAVLQNVRHRKKKGIPNTSHTMYKIIVKKEYTVFKEQQNLHG